MEQAERNQREIELLEFMKRMGYEINQITPHQNFDEYEFIFIWEADDYVTVEASFNGVGYRLRMIKVNSLFFVNENFDMTFDELRNKIIMFSEANGIYVNNI
jgi:hypothetical protein